MTLSIHLLLARLFGNQQLLGWWQGTATSFLNFMSACHQCINCNSSGSCGPFIIYIKQHCLDTSYDNKTEAGRWRKQQGFSFTSKLLSFLIEVCHETDMAMSLPQGVLPKSLGGGVPHSSPNPDPISDQNI